MQRATIIFVCVIAVSKSHELLLKVRRLSSTFSAATPTPSRGRVVIFFHDDYARIRLRRRVDVLFTTSDTSPRHCVGDDHNVLTDRYSALMTKEVNWRCCSVMLFYNFFSQYF